MNEMTSTLYAINGVAVLLLGLLLLCISIVRKGHHLWYGVAVLIAIFGVGYLVIPKPPVYEYTRDKDGCCKVVGLQDLYTWRLKKTDGEFTAKFCHDYDLADYNPAPGLLMWKLRYQDLGICWSVRRKDLGFWWLRDASQVVVREAYD